MSDTSDTETIHDAAIETIARRYHRALNEHEARQERLLAKLAEEYYEPGYLRADEWEDLKECVSSNTETDWDAIELIVELAIYRRALTELGEATDDDEWPAAPGGTS